MTDIEYMRYTAEVLLTAGRCEVLLQRAFEMINIISSRQLHPVNYDLLAGNGLQPEVNKLMVICIDIIEMHIETDEQAIKRLWLSCIAYWHHYNLGG